MKFSVPLKVKVSKNKHFILNLNNYRNAYYRTLNNAKQNFTDIILSMALPRQTFDKIRIHYKIYPPSNRLYDGNNIICIVNKFLEDALVKRGIIKDDNIKHVSCYTWQPMPPDKDNPRVEVEIEDISNGLNH